MDIQTLVTGVMIRPPRNDWRLRFYDLIIDLADKYHKKYFEHWETDRLKIKLHDDKKKMTALLEFNRLLFLLEDQSYKNEFEEMTKNFSADFCKQMAIKKLMRLAITHTAIVPYDGTFEALVEKLKPRFYPESDAVKEVLGRNYLDVAFVATVKKHGFKCNINIGPVKKLEIVERLQQKSFYIKQANLPDVALWIDLRLEDDELDANKINPSIAGASEKAEEMVKSFAEFSLE